MTKVSRKTLKNELERSLTNPRIVLLEPKDYDGMIDVLAEAFLEDPMATYVTGLDGLAIDQTKKRELQTKCNEFFMAWVNRPILVRKKGVALGIQENGELVGAMTLVPGGTKTDGFFDVVTNLMATGPPPFYTSEKTNYSPFADKRLESLGELPKRKKELMKGKDYIYLQTVGVKSAFQGKGYGGMMLKLLLDISRSMHVEVYLETESESNESLYKHFGFRTLETIELQGEGDTTDAKFKGWLMHRPPV